MTHASIAQGWFDTHSTLFYDSGEGCRGESMLSIPHLIIIFLVALIVFGPEKLPELARTLSKAMFEFNRATGGLKETLQNEMQQLEREIMDQRAAGTASREPSPAVAPEAAWPPEPVIDHPSTESEPSDDGAGEPEAEPNEVAAGEAAVEPAPATHAEENEATVEVNADKTEPDPDPKPGQPSNGHPTAA